MLYAKRTGEEESPSVRELEKHDYRKLALNDNVYPYFDWWIGDIQFYTVDRQRTVEFFEYAAWEHPMTTPMIDADDVILLLEFQKKKLFNPILAKVKEIHVIDDGSKTAPYIMASFKNELFNESTINLMNFSEEEKEIFEDTTVLNRHSKNDFKIDLKNNHFFYVLKRLDADENAPIIRAIAALNEQVGRQPDRAKVLMKNELMRLYKRIDKG